MAVVAASAMADLLLTYTRMASPQRNRPANRCEVFLGRSLAACAHPIAAWRSTVRPFRLLVVVSYFAIGYVAVIGAMILLMK